jgi:PhnB protein
MFDTLRVPGRWKEPVMSDQYVYPGHHTVAASITVRDAGNAIDFYKDIFGATEPYDRFVDPNGRVGHAELVIGDTAIMLNDEYPEMGIVSPSTLGGQTGSLTVYVPDTDATIARAVAAGAEVTRPAADQFYGARSGMIRDPFGIIWGISTFQRAVPAEEMQRHMKAYRETGDVPGES